MMSFQIWNNQKLLLYSGKFSRTINFAVFVDFTPALKNTSSIRMYNASLIDPTSLAYGNSCIKLYP